MVKALKWTLGFGVAYVTLALAALAYDPIPEALSAREIDPHLLAVVVGGVLALGVFVAGLAASDREWKAWKERFRYAGPARRIDVDAIVGPTRPMSQPYAAAPRALYRPVTRQTLGEPRVRVATDAEQFLRETVLLGPKLGMLLQGRPLLGKTRFLAEWLRHEHPRMMVLAPKPQEALPSLPGRLRRSARHGLCLFLDDIDRFQDRILEVREFLADLAGLAGEAPFLVLATVRDDAPAGVVASDAGYRTFREDLHHVEIDPPTDEQRATAGQRAGEAPGDEPSFAFLLGEEFEVQKNRYRALLGEETEAGRNALRLLKAAKLLDDRGILLTPSRTRGVAAALFGFDVACEDAADRRLRSAGFTDGDVFEPAHLRHVVPDPAGPLPALADLLHEHLRQSGDVGALYEWGLSRFYAMGDDQLVRELLVEAVEHSKASETPDDLVRAATAGFGLGYVLHRADEVREAARAYSHAADAGREAGTAEGLVRAAKAESNLGVLLTEVQNPEGATAAFLRAAKAGREAETAEGLVDAAKAEFNLGVFLRRLGDDVRAREAYARAVEVGEQAGTAEGVLQVAKAECNLGVLLTGLGESEAEAARAAFVRAIVAGQEVGTAEGLIQVATAE